MSYPLQLLLNLCIIYVLHFFIVHRNPFGLSNEYTASSGQVLDQNISEKKKRL